MATKDTVEAELLAALAPLGPGIHAELRSPVSPKSFGLVVYYPAFGHTCCIFCVVPDLALNWPIDVISRMYIDPIVNGIASDQRKWARATHDTSGTARGSAQEQGGAGESRA